MSSRCRVACATGLLLLSANIHGAPSVTLYYNERPPYLVTAAGGGVSGLTATPAANAFRSAGIAFGWSKLPTNRQMAVLKENRAAECAVGWFRNAERESFARYTKAIYRDRPTVALASVSFAPKSARLNDLLHAGGVTVLVKDGFSYGPYIDGLLGRSKPSQITTTAENSQMVQMVAAQRADFMFVSEEEAAYLAEQAGADAGRLKVIRFEDVPPGEKRYILCSRQVPEETIRKLNGAIMFE